MSQFRMTEFGTLEIVTEAEVKETEAETKAETAPAHSSTPPPEAQSEPGTARSPANQLHTPALEGKTTLQFSKWLCHSHMNSVYFTQRATL